MVGAYIGHFPKDEEDEEDDLRFRILRISALEFGGFSERQVS